MNLTDELERLQALKKEINEKLKLTKRTAKSKRHHVEQLNYICPSCGQTETNYKKWSAVGGIFLVCLRCYTFSSALELNSVEQCKEVLAYAKNLFRAKTNSDS